MLLAIYLVSCSSSHPCKDNQINCATDFSREKTHNNFSENFMITTQGSASTKAALYAYQKGGNIIDAAVAASLSISVERPQSTGIGGGGFLIYYNAKKDRTYVYDFRERGPLKSHSKMYLDSKGDEIKRLSLDGPLAIGVPGLLAGLDKIHREHGKLKISKLFNPAIALADGGMKVYPHLAKALKARSHILKKYPKGSRHFFKPDGSPIEAGDILYQKDLAQTLKTLKSKGIKDFYRGGLAKKLVAGLKEYGAIISNKDMRVYKVKKKRPITTTFKGYKVVSMPPPSSGGTHIVQILNMLEQLDFSKLHPQGVQYIHYLATAMQMAFADRAEYMGDTDFVKVPIKKLTSKKYAKKLFKRIPSNRVLKPSEILPVNREILSRSNTTHFSIMDKEGNVVVSTQTINGWFGSALVAPGLGIVMNNEMDDFSTKPGAINLFGAVGGKNNLVEARKTPLSSMSPSIVYKDGKPVLALGTPNGTKILTCVAQTILNYIGHKMDLWDAVNATRIHQQWYPDELRVESSGLSEDTIQKLKELGHNVVTKESGCKVQAIAMEDGKLHGVSDPRGEGLAYGN